MPEIVAVRGTYQSDFKLRDQVRTFPEQAQQAAIAQQIPQQDVGQNSRVDVAAGYRDADLLSAKPLGVG